ncbi:hypothetical protein MJO28_015564 [Puccinia striiformis f. sp. tritici]|uniref:Uncharacterized protein n=2 Tax=Puccinia striiformis TaxID=27350 RepID=A0A2S4VB68_9BASI|nr:hypothetical protein MJO28_015564 [Puccinia striiformis f. sp. tritici]POW06789.1 hypothetical protein PSHT_10231 [Puccinia striiformis]
MDRAECCDKLCQISKSGWEGKTEILSFVEPSIAVLTSVAAHPTSKPILNNRYQSQHQQKRNQQV